MCGIFGAVRLDGCFDESELIDLRRSVDLVSHRGPDSGSYKFFNNPRGRSVFLGHRRLSIIDLSEGGNQPMENDGTWIVFNGEIFNYVEIRETLKKLGHVFTSESDTEVILRTYHHYGPEGFNLFNGMWAIILFDQVNQKVVVSRDRFSIKPLYFYEKNNTLYFSSEQRQLLPYLSNRKPNLRALNTFLIQSLQDHNEETFFDGIQKLPTKSNLIIDLNANTRKIEKYWDYVDATQMDDEEAIEKFKEALYYSVKIRLRSDVEVGCLLSGGLDSSIISIISNEVGSKPIRTFSVVSTDRSVSEEKFIDIMVYEKNLINEKIVFSPTQAIQQLDQCLFYQEQPFGGASIIAQYMIYELIKKKAGVKVVLSGQGGDEALMGYLKYFFFYINQLRLSGDYMKAAKEVLYSLANRTAVIQFNIGQAKRYIPKLASKQLNYLPSSAALLEIWKVDSIRDRQINDLDHYSVPALTHFEDRNSMAHSIESRTPFLDHNLVNLLVNLPASLKFKNGWSKYILRSTFSQLPNQIRWRRDKKGFTVPEDSWCKNSLREDIRSIGRKSLLAEYGVLDAVKFGEYFEKFLKGDSRTNSKEIFSVLIAEKWLKKNFE